MSNKFSATEWKNLIEKDLIEIKKAIFDIYSFINKFESWRRLSFNQGVEDENNQKENLSNEQLKSSNTKGKKPRNKNLHRKSRKKSK